MEIFHFIISITHCHAHVHSSVLNKTEMLLVIKKQRRTVRLSRLYAINLYSSIVYIDINILTAPTTERQTSFTTLKEAGS